MLNFKGRKSRTIFQRIIRMMLYSSLLALLIIYTLLYTHLDTATATSTGTTTAKSLINCTCVFPAKMLSAEVEYHLGRLGNQFFLYATLFAFAKRNNRTAFLSPAMAWYIFPYFKISMEKISQVRCVPWKIVEIPLHPSTCAKPQMIQEPYVMFFGFPRSYKCFQDYFPEIRKEFQFKDGIVNKAKEIINKIVKKLGYNDKTAATTVGVHVRRTDYIKYALVKRFQLPTIEFYKGAMKYFQQKSKNVIFIIASDDIRWCKSNFNQLEFNLKFLNVSPKKGMDNFAVLINCDHLIFGIGTYGVWAGFLNRGQVVYCSDCHSKNSTWVKNMVDYGNFVLPSWIGFNLNGEQKSFSKWINKSILNQS